MYTDIKQSENFANNLRAKIKLARQEAVLQQATLRLVITDKEYGFQKLKKGEKSYFWDWLPAHSILKKTALKKEVLIEKNQSIEFYPNGRFSIFSIILSDPQKKASIIIMGDENGEIGVNKIEK